jgi:hypothetical protein
MTVKLLVACKLLFIIYKEDFKKCKNYLLIINMGLPIFIFFSIVINAFHGQIGSKIFD